MSRASAPASLIAATADSASGHFEDHHSNCRPHYCRCCSSCPQQLGTPTLLLLLLLLPQQLGTHIPLLLLLPLQLGTPISLLMLLLPQQLSTPTLLLLLLLLLVTLLASAAGHTHLAAGDAATAMLPAQLVNDLFLLRLHCCQALSQHPVLLGQDRHG
jgi:hypothetical protein